MTAGSRRERGLALVSVLWGTAILSLIAAAMLTASVTYAYIGRNTWDAARGASLDEAAIHHALLTLMDTRPGAQPRVDGTASGFRLDGAAARVWIQDEAGKINLNTADEPALLSLFASAGVGRDAAGRLAEAILARRQPLDPQSPPPAVAFRSVDELLGVPGMSPALYARVAPLLTVYGKAAFSRDVAPRAVLLALPDMDAKAVDELLAERDRHPPVPSIAQSAAFTVTAEARIGAARVVRAAVVQFTGDPEKPYWFLAWK